MCFIIHPKHPKVIKAKKDFVCLKQFLVDSDFSSKSKTVRAPYHTQIYELGECYFESGFERKADKFATVHEGFHSYHLTRLKTVRKWGAQFTLRTMVVFMKCIIPEGAHYYNNPDREEYVSDYVIIGEMTDIVYIGGYMDMTNLKSILTA